MTPLRNSAYRRLFLAQIVALAGTGLATVALGLLAFQLAGEEAGQVLGTALAIKMIAYVTIAPIANALAERLPRRPLLISLDILRALIVLALPFVSAVWHIYLLILLLQATSAAFTPTFQACIPSLLPNEKDYTKALALSRLAYDLESLLSPLLAALLLSLMSFDKLFFGTTLGFVASALLVAATHLPPIQPGPKRSFYQRTLRGLRQYWLTPRLRALLAVNLAVAAAGSMVFVNTVVIVQGHFALSQTDVALSLAAFGAGSMLGALLLSKLLERISIRPLVLANLALLSLSLPLGVLVTNLLSLLPLWFLLGLGYSLAQTPSGQLLRRSSNEENRAALFAAHFALSHAAWLICYPLAGWAGQQFGLAATFILLAALAACASLLAWRCWPHPDDDELEHQHPELSADHPHLHLGKAGVHKHHYVIDDLHPHWPER